MVLSKVDETVLESVELESAGLTSAMRRSSKTRISAAGGLVIAAAPSLPIESHCEHLMEIEDLKLEILIIRRL